jgi:hypothetical protein
MAKVHFDTCIGSEILLQLSKELSRSELISALQFKRIELAIKYKYINLIEIAIRHSLKFAILILIQYFQMGFNLRAKKVNDV